ncbi:hypothetical protein NKDENANG_01825 [Candidatus Entotheonellaceae bacterium PAL068K]
MNAAADTHYRYRGLEWLGDLPAPWVVTRLKFVSQIAASGVWGEDPVSEADGARVATTATIDRQGNINTAGMPIRALSQRELEIGQCQPGDLIVVKSSGSATNVVSGKAGLVKENHLPISFSNFTLRVRPTPAVLEPRFVWRFLNLEVVKAQIRLMVATTTYPNLQVGEYASFYLPLPDYENQRAIADYLDRETARLHGLIAAKERVLGLVAEKRRALISRAVTRGLDPRAPLRDSGVPWLGEIPAHWKLMRLKFATLNLQTGPFGSQLHAEEYVTGGIPVVNPSHLKAGRICADDRVSVDQATAERLAIHRLRPSDIVFARRGEPGRCGVVELVQAGWLCGTGSLRARLRPEVADPYYVALVFTETRVSDGLTFESVGSTMDNLNTEILGACQLGLPPLSEQRAIVAHLATETTRLDALCSATERTIALLKERRTALITAAVTGQFAVEEVSCP